MRDTPLPFGQNVNPIADDPAASWQSVRPKRFKARTRELGPSSYGSSFPDNLSAAEAATFKSPMTIVAACFHSRTSVVRDEHSSAASRRFGAVLSGALTP